MFVLEYFIAHIPLVCLLSAAIGAIIAGIVRYTLHAICGD